MAEIWPPPPPPGPAPSLSLGARSRLALAPLPSQPAGAGADPSPGALAYPAARARGCFREQVKMAENLLDGPPNPKRAKLSSPGFSANDSTGETGAGAGGRGPRGCLSAPYGGECPRETPTRLRAVRGPRSEGPRSPFPRTPAAEGEVCRKTVMGPEWGGTCPVRLDRPELESPPRRETEWYFQGGKVKWSVCILRGDSVCLPLPPCVRPHKRGWLER